MTGTNAAGDVPASAQAGGAMFESARFVVRELDRAELPRLQALYEANPDYFHAVSGRGPAPDEAQVEFDELPPPHLSWRRRWVGGIFDRAGELAGVTIVVADLVAPAVWHIALFLLAARLHGSGAAAELHGALAAWAQRGGARWLRLGVVVGNTRAERFWERQGYREVRRRPWSGNGAGTTAWSRVMIRPLGDDSVDGYLARVERDRPDSTLP